MNTLKHIRAILLLPVMVTLIIPGDILHTTGTVNKRLSTARLAFLPERW